MGVRRHYEVRQALGTQVHINLVTNAADIQVAAWLRGFWLEIFLFEKRCSRFVQSSELSLFNRQAGSKQPVSPEFRAILLEAKRMGEQTGGVYNPFVLPALQRAGYVRSMVPGFYQDPVDDHSDRHIAPVSALEIGDTWATIPYGSALDLGGCGKGFIGDVLAAKAAEIPELQGFWFSIGGDTVTGGVDTEGRPWTVYITPHISRLDEEDRLAQAVAPADGTVLAVATSTVRFRQGKTTAPGGPGKPIKAWHHIIDPRTGQPANTDVALASVSGSSLLEADVLASCAIIMGEKSASAFVGNAITGLLLQTADGRTATYGPGIGRL